jgi:hypothetical protein
MQCHAQQCRILCNMCMCFTMNRTLVSVAIAVSPQIRMARHANDGKNPDARHIARQYASHLPSDHTMPSLAAALPVPTPLTGTSHHSHHQYWPRTRCCSRCCCRCRDHSLCCAAHSSGSWAQQGSASLPWARLLLPVNCCPCHDGDGSGVL